MNRRVGTVLLGTLVACTSPIASSSTIGLTIFDSILATSIPTTYSSGLQPGPTIQHSASSANIDGQAEVSGTLGFGSIAAAVSASSVCGPTGGRCATDVALFSGTWQDTLTVTSATLAMGTPVEFLASMFNDFTTICEGPNTQVGAAVAYQFGADQLGADFVTCNSALFGTQSIDVFTTVGATLQLEGQVNIQANAEAIHLNTSSHSAVDPPAEFFFDPISSGVSYTTGSGTDYRSPTNGVPEPTTLVLLCVGLVGLRVSRQSRPS